MVDMVGAMPVDISRFASHKWLSMVRPSSSGTRFSGDTLSLVCTPTWLAKVK